MDNLTGNLLGQWAAQKEGGLARIVVHDFTLQRGKLSDVFLHEGKPWNACSRSRRIRAGRKPVHTDAMLPKVICQVFNHIIKRCLGNTHELVTRDYSFTSQVSESQYTAATLAHERQRATSQGDQGVCTHVH